MSTRRDFLKKTAVAASTVAAATSAGKMATSVASAAAPSSLRPMNMILFITDQERHIQHFPDGWSQQNLPGLSRLQRYGLTFENAFTNACMCSPARSTFMSGYLPAQHGVKYTLENDMPSPQYPQVELPKPGSMTNLATVAAAAGYNVVYKGKWHCSKPAAADFVWTPQDLAAYGWSRWNPQDAGANQDIPEMGGGLANNDARFMASVGGYEDSSEGVLQFITQVAATMQPFFLVISLVNPHDVLAYPSKYAQAGYSPLWLKGDIGLPATATEDLSTKPTAQRAFLKLSNGLGRLRNDQQKRNYLNFYGNLMRASDQYLVDTLAALGSVATQNGASTLLKDSVVVRTADHGEMGLAHGSQRQKNFMMYDEATKVPLVFSNPTLWKRPKTSQALVSHVDFLPTMASLLGAPSSARSAWQGVDYSPIILGASRKPVQDYVVFTYDDYQAGQNNGPYVPPPQHLVGIRERNWKICLYYDTAGTVPPQWELYDLANDPLEQRNLAWPGTRRTPTQQRNFRRLQAKLVKVWNARLQPLSGSAPFPVTLPGVTS
jgi:arylsulfatase A-like enzyme